MPDFLFATLCAASCQVRPERALLVRRQQLAPGLEDLLTFGSVPGLLALHQLHVEVVAVDAHVEVSKVPIAGQPSLSANAIGVMPSFFICLQQRGELVERLGGTS